MITNSIRRCNNSSSVLIFFPFWRRGLSCLVLIAFQIFQISVQFSCSVVSNSLWPHGLQGASLSSPTPRVYSNSYPLSRWCHSTISSSVIPFSHPQSFPASGSFPMSQFFASGGQRIEASASASVLPVNIQSWFPLRLTGLISLHSKGLRQEYGMERLFVLQGIF